MATVFLLDSEPFTRDGIRTYLHNSTSHQVVGEEESGLNAIPKILGLRPEILISDLYLKGLDGLEVIRRISTQLPSLGILVNTRKLESSYVARSISYGAKAYILKNCTRNQLTGAISSVLNGKTYFCSAVSRFVDEHGNATDLYEELTTREREVLQLVAEGKTAAEITDVLFISVRTVEKHRSNLMKKLSIHSHNDLIRYALQRSLIPFNDSEGEIAA